MRSQIVQVKQWALGLVRVMVVRLCAAVGVEVVRPGWRQIPAGRIDIDPALVNSLKTPAALTMAVIYAVIDAWNRSNERAGKRDHLKDGRWWSWGWPKYWTTRSVPFMAARTWERNVQRLVEAGLLQVGTMHGQPAYSAIGYRVTGVGQLDIFDGQSVEGVRQLVNEVGQSVVYTTDKLTIPKHFNLSTSTAARRKRVNPNAAAAEFRKTTLGDFDGDQISETAQDGAAWRDEGEQPSADRRNPHPLAPSPFHREGEPARNWDTTLNASTLADGYGSTEYDDATQDGYDTKEIEAFFNGCSRDEVRQMVAAHGRARVGEVIEAVRAKDGVNNPPGLARSLLAKEARTGWTFPPRKGEQDGKRYVSGKYADFIES